MTLARVRTWLAFQAELPAALAPPIRAAATRAFDRAVIALHDFVEEVEHVATHRRDRSRP